MTDHFSINAALKTVAHGFVLSIYAQPGASRTEIVGMHGPRLKIKIKAPPVEGKANEAVVKFLKKLLKPQATAISLLRGEKSREKDVLIVSTSSVDEIINLLSAE